MNNQVAEGQRIFDVLGPEGNKLWTFSFVQIVTDLTTGSTLFGSLEVCI